jgi:NNP family nitrate/nitrite transporter-like MFS transporter
VITVGVFGGGEPSHREGGQTAGLGAERRLHLGALDRAAAVAAWFGMNDIADAKASFADQAAIFRASTTG